MANIMRHKRIISIFVILSSFIYKIEAQNNLIIDTTLIVQFLNWKLDKLESSEINLCTEPLIIKKDVLECPPNPKSIALEKGCICNYLNSADINYMKEQRILISQNSISIYSSLDDSFNIINCDSANNYSIIHTFSFPLFSLDKNTTLIEYKLNKEYFSSDRIDLYKKDDKNNWNYFTTIFRIDIGY